MKNTSTNTEPTAIDAAAERRLSDLRAKRIAAAETKLDAARARLATAQAAEQKAAAGCAVYEGGANVTALREARDETAIAEPLVAHHEREAARAKERTTPREREAMRALVEHEREAAAFLPRVDAVKVQVQATAATLIEQVRALLAITNDQHHHMFERREASEQLGLPFDERMLAVPNGLHFAADAILSACRAASFSPYDWRDMDPARMNVRQPPIAGALAVLEPHTALVERMDRWQAQLHGEVAASEAAKAAGALAQLAHDDAEARDRFADQDRRMQNARAQASGIATEARATAEL